MVAEDLGSARRQAAGRVEWTREGDRVTFESASTTESFLDRAKLELFVTSRSRRHRHRSIRCLGAMRTLMTRAKLLGCERFLEWRNKCVRLSRVYFLFYTSHKGYRWWKSPRSLAHLLLQISKPDSTLPFYFGPVSVSLCSSLANAILWYALATLLTLSGSRASCSS